MSYGSVDMYAEMSDSKHVYNTSTGLACVLYNMLARSLARPVSSCTYFTPEFRCAANANGWYQPTITPPFTYEDPHVYPLPIGRQSAHLEQESPRTRALIRPYAVLSVILRLALTYLHLFPSQRLLFDRTSPIANRLYNAILPIYRPPCPHHGSTIPPQNRCWCLGMAWRIQVTVAWQNSPKPDYLSVCRSLPIDTY